jgi:hypothetical protein
VNLHAGEPPPHAAIEHGHGCDDEVADLLRLAQSLKPRAPASREALDDLIATTRAELGAAQQPAARERISEAFARSLRQIWLEACTFSTSRSYRSPPTTETTKTTTGRAVDFGYERDLHPVHLEERCSAFFGPPPQGWSADHILLSSGQSGMAAVLHALEGASVFQAERRRSVVHYGSYFETGEILGFFGSLLSPVGQGRAAVEAMDRVDADISIVEPVYCDGAFGVVDVERLIAGHTAGQRPRVFMFDNTLCGTRYSVETLLPALEAAAPAAVFRIFSGLKLFQAGLELSSVGILSVFTRDGGQSPDARELGERIRRIRTLLGLGLSFVEVAALEAPWFLDRGHTHGYEQAVFDNNAALARAVADANRLFVGTFHPCLLSGAGAKGAPYSAYRLRERSPDAYSALEQHILDEARRRGLVFDWGGSFGFRGHRFEVVRPESGAEPFLRVALGRRSGASCDGIIELMTDIARAPTVADIA